MNSSMHDITLNIHGHGSNVSVRAKRGDTGRVLRITLMDGRKPYILTGECRAVLTAKKEDGNILYNACEIVGNTICYEFTPQTTSFAGKANCEIKLYGADDKLLTSARFALLVEDTVYNEGDEVEPEKEVSALTALVSDATTLIHEVENKLENGEFDGSSAYEIAVFNGFEGTIEEWLESIKGEPGKPGDTPVKGVDYFTEEEVQEIAEQAAGMVDEVFVGGVYTATYAEYETAYAEGKACFAKQNVTQYPLVRMDASTGAMFSGYDHALKKMVYYTLSTNNEWTYGTIPMNVREYIDETSQHTHIPTAKAVYEALQNVGGASSWNDLEDKPFGEVPSDTITWDGNTEGLVSFVDEYEGDTFYKMSDSLPTAENLYTAVTKFANGDELSGKDSVVVPDEPYLAIADEDGMDCVIVILESGVRGAAEPGVYFRKRSDDGYIQSITIPGYTGFTAIKKLDGKYLPNIGGAELMYVNVSVDSNGNATADKTYAEIVETSLEGNTVVMAVVTFLSNPGEIIVLHPVGLNAGFALFSNTVDDGQGTKFETTLRINADDTAEFFIGNTSGSGGGVKTVNGIAPDANGNVEIAVSGGGGGNLEFIGSFGVESGVSSVGFDLGAEYRRILIADASWGTAALSSGEFTVFVNATYKNNFKVGKSSGANSVWKYSVMTIEVATDSNGVSFANFTINAGGANGATTNCLAGTNMPEASSKLFPIRRVHFVASTSDATFNAKTYNIWGVKV